MNAGRPEAGTAAFAASRNRFTIVLDWLHPSKGDPRLEYAGSVGTGECRDVTAQRACELVTTCRVGHGRDQARVVFGHRLCPRSGTVGI